MSLEDKYPRWYLFLHFWSYFLGPIVLAVAGFYFAEQNKLLENSNAEIPLVIASDAEQRRAEEQRDAAKAVVNDSPAEADIQKLVSTNPAAIAVINDAVATGALPDLSDSLKQTVSASPQVVSSKYSLKIWYPKGKQALRQQAFAMKNRLVRAGYRNIISVFSTGGVLINRYSPPPNNQLSFNSSLSISPEEQTRVIEAVSKLLDTGIEAGSETVSDFDMVLVVGAGT